jgi:hypothetical protein
MNSNWPTARRVHHGPVPRDSNPLWYIRGWRREGNKYFGFFQTGRRRWGGELLEISPGNYQVFIENAPSAVLAGAHRACFHQDFSRSHGATVVHRIHQSPAPRSPEEAIHAVEKILTTA